MSAIVPINQLDPSMTAPLTLPAPLSDIPGGETNLLHRTAWSDPANPLRVELKPWYISPPPPGTETVVVFLDDDESKVIGSRTWTLPMDPNDYFIEVSADKLPQGQHTISFIMTNFVGVPAQSFPYTVTIDKQEPLLNALSQLRFPAEVLPPNKLTARYLELNNDRVIATIPAYTSPRPGDRITWYWGDSVVTEDQGGVIVLDDKNYSGPLEIKIEGQLIRDRKDGLRYVLYRVHDRAGNPSVRSDPVQLTVDAQPIPRTFPEIKVKEATGGAASGVLNPSNAINGVTVVVPPETVIYDGEPLFAQWAEPGTAGAHRTDTPITPGTREYRIPSNKVAWHIDKTLLVHYEVFEAGIVDPHKSAPYTLRVEKLNNPPTVQCDRVSGNNLKLANIPAGDFANFTLVRWAFMATDQFLTVAVHGVDSSNESLSIPVLTESPVPPEAPTIAVGRISKANLQRFKIGTQLEVRVRVSFDGKSTWQTFPSLRPTLIA